MEKYKQLVKKAFQYALEEPLAYSQVELIEKFKTYGMANISPSTMSNLHKQKDRVGIKTWKSAAQVFQQLLKNECGLEYNEEKKDFVLSDKNTFDQYKQDILKTLSLPKNGISFHARGRLTIQEKVSLISSAKHQVIELGVGLRTFCSYFYNRSYFEFQQHVEKLLEKNVEYQCLLLEPTTQISETYLKDRNELYLIEDIKKSIDKLTQLSKHFHSKQLEGQFLVSTYNHIPYNHFCAIDPEKEYGKMIISPYILGVRRADAPVYEINRKEHQYLFENYWKSLQLYQKNKQDISCD